MIIAYTDFKSPAAYLAFRGTRELATELNVAVEWRPFRSSERAAPTRVADQTVTANHMRARAETRRALHAHYASARGLTLNWPERALASDVALGALACLGGDPEPFMTAAFNAYWIDNRDLDDPQVVQALLAQAGAVIEVFDEEGLRSALDTVQTQAEAEGVVDAPAFVVEDQLFVGREHFPWIRELLTAS
ncbi:MAG: DsbA family protein [Pseudomonadota bacterium]